MYIYSIHTTNLCIPQTYTYNIYIYLYICLSHSLSLSLYIYIFYKNNIYIYIYINIFFLFPISYSKRSTKKIRAKSIITKKPSGRIEDPMNPQRGIIGSPRPQPDSTTTKVGLSVRRRAERSARPWRCRGAERRAPQSELHSFIIIKPRVFVASNGHVPPPTASIRVSAHPGQESAESVRLVSLSAGGGRRGGGRAGSGWNPHGKRTARNRRGRRGERVGGAGGRGGEGKGDRNTRGRHRVARM